MKINKILPLSVTLTGVTETSAGKIATFTGENRTSTGIV